MPIVYITADSAQISLLSIYIVSLDEDNDMSALSFSNINNLLKEHILNNSNNADEGLSFHFYKDKFTLKMKIKDKDCIISALAIKKQTVTAAKLKFKIVFKLKAKFKIKSVK